MFTASSVYGQAPASPSYGVAAPTQGMATVSDFSDGWRGLCDPRNPLLWLGGFLLATVGLAGVAGSVRLGKAKVSAQVGTT
jgi:hypothetical protein